MYTAMAIILKHNTRSGSFDFQHSPSIPISSRIKWNGKRTVQFPKNDFNFWRRRSSSRGKHTLTRWYWNTNSEENLSRDELQDYNLSWQHPLVPHRWTKHNFQVALLSHRTPPAARPRWFPAFKKMRSQLEFALLRWINKFRTTGRHFCFNSF